MSLIFILIMILIFASITSMIRYYSDNKESHWLTTMISVIGISLSLVYITFIPFDIYLTSQGLDHFTVPLIPIVLNIKTVYGIL